MSGSSSAGGASLKDSRNTTVSLQRTRAVMERNLSRMDTAMRQLSQDGELIKDSLDEHAVELKGALRSTKTNLKAVQAAEVWERYSLKAALAFFFSVVFYIVCKRTRVLALCVFTLKQFLYEPAVVFPPPSPEAGCGEGGCSGRFETHYEGVVAAHNEAPPHGTVVDVPGDINDGAGGAGEWEEVPAVCDDDVCRASDMERDASTSAIITKVGDEDSLRETDMTFSPGAGTNAPDTVEDAAVGASASPHLFMPREGPGETLVPEITALSTDPPAVHTTDASGVSSANYRPSTGNENEL